MGIYTYSQILFLMIYLALLVTFNYKRLLYFQL